MKNLLLVDPSLCTGCRTCELACSFFHEKVFSPSFSRVTVVVDYERGYFIPQMCQQCQDPPCVKSCPTEAITKNEETGAVEVDYDVCIGCLRCFEACPFGAIKIRVDNLKPLVCDLCEGDPQCVKFCPREAIKYVPAVKANLLKKKETLLNFAKYASQVVERALPSGGVDER